jgi:transglutaminase-like putative cysteine protease
MKVSRLRVISLWVLAGLLACLASAGCSDSAPVPSRTPPADRFAVPAAAQPQTTSAPQRETWDITYIMGSRAGYTRTTVSYLSHAGRKAVRMEAVDHLDVKRSGERIKPGSRVLSIETPQGTLLEFESEMQLGPAPVRTVGRVVTGHLELETTSQGKKMRTSIPWSAEYGGPFAAEESLRRRPLEPGGQRTLQALVPGFNQLATVTMAARDYESVELPIGTRNLLRIDTALRFPSGQVLKGSMWADRQGDTLKTRIDALSTEKVRATRALALEEAKAVDLDLLWDVAVQVDRRLPDPHHTKRIRYRVQLADGNPATVFISGPSQRVKSIDAHTAEVTVYALRPGEGGGNPDAPDDPPTDDDRRPNNLIQSDNPKIVAMARKAAGEAKDPWKIAVALERYVNQLITEKDFSRAFATAAEVADNPVGDCTEHAVLLAALARVRGIPARAAMGLVYMQGKQSFGYHMWDEVYVDGRWMAIDATLGQGGIGAAHLELAHSSLQGASAYSAFLPVIQVIGQLKIQIEEFE